MKLRNLLRRIAAHSFLLLSAGGGSLVVAQTLVQMQEAVDGFDADGALVMGSGVVRAQAIGASSFVDPATHSLGTECADGSGGTVPCLVQRDQAADNSGLGPDAHAGAVAPGGAGQGESSCLKLDVPDYVAAALEGRSPAATTPPAEPARAPASTGTPPNPAAPVAAVPVAVPGPPAVVPPANPAPGGVPPRPIVPPTVAAAAAEPGPMQVVRTSDLTNLGDAADLARTAAANGRGVEIINAALAQREAVYDASRHDQGVMNAAYAQMPLPELANRLERAQTVIADTANTLAAATGAAPGASGLGEGERNRFRNLYMNAADKAALGADALTRDMAADDSKNVAALGGMLNPAGPGSNSPLARTKSMADIFGGGGRPADPRQAAISQDALTDRIIMFSGLPEGERKAAAARMKFVENASVTLAGGATRTVQLLHNGYLLGGGKSGLDCSSFVSTALPVELRKGQFTTLDFRLMWLYRKEGKMPRPPLMAAGREAAVKKVAEAFTPVDIYAGERLQVGDLLVFRLPWQNVGHIFIVRDYNPVTMRAEVLEAAQSAGTVREREFPMSLSPMNAKKRYVRPGFLVLRLKTSGKGACTLKADAGKPPVPGSG